MRDKIKLVSSAGTGHYYTTDKNKRTMPEKLEMKEDHSLQISILSTGIIIFVTVVILTI